MCYILTFVLNQKHTLSKDKNVAVFLSLYDQFFNKNITSACFYILILDD